MPLFQSQESRTYRLFRDLIHELMAEIDAFTSRSPGAGVSHRACVYGGALAARRVAAECPTVKKAWGRGNTRTVRALTEVFTLAMASRHYWKRDQFEAHPDTEKKQAREVFATNLVALFGNHPPTSVDDFMKLDAQFNHDRKLSLDETHSGICIAEEELLLSRALQACGYPSGLEVSQLTLPVQDTIELIAQGGHPDSSSLREVIIMKDILGQAELEMYVLVNDVAAAMSSLRKQPRRH